MLGLIWHYWGLVFVRGVAMDGRDSLEVDELPPTPVPQSYTSVWASLPMVISHQGVRLSNWNTLQGHDALSPVDRRRCTQRASLQSRNRIVIAQRCLLERIATSGSAIRKVAMSGTTAGAPVIYFIAKRTTGKPARVHFRAQAEEHAKIQSRCNERGCGQLSTIFFVVYFALKNTHHSIQNYHIAEPVVHHGVKHNNPLGAWKHGGILCAKSWKDFLYLSKQDSECPRMFMSCTHCFILCSVLSLSQSTSTRRWCREVRRKTGCPRY